MVEHSAKLLTSKEKPTTILRFPQLLVAAWTDSLSYLWQLGQIPSATCGNLDRMSNNSNILNDASHTALNNSMPALFFPSEDQLAYTNSTLSGQASVYSGSMC